MVIKISTFQSPCGALRLGAIGDRLCMCDWVERPNSMALCSRMMSALRAEMVDGSSPILDMMVQQLDEYFGGTRRSFEVRVRFVGTPFQQQVWSMLCEIPYGSTVSYRTLAERIGRGSAVRAVANAIGANPLSIIVPCHRVIGSNGTLTGYAGGLEAKRYLLGLESSLPFV